MKTIKHAEIRLSNGQIAILDTAEIHPGTYETMLMYRNGTEITSATTTSEAQAVADFDHLRKQYESTALTGKYAKLADDLRKAAAAGISAGKCLGNDGGTCNFDSPEILLPRWRESLVMEAAKAAGVGCFRCPYTGAYVFPLRAGFQGNANTEAAETARDVLIDAGYNASVYYQVD